jgi:hypothetical protein
MSHSYVQARFAYGIICTFVSMDKPKRSSSLTDVLLGPIDT